MEEKGGKLYGNDSTGPVRIRVNEVHQNKPGFSGHEDEFHEIPHMHIDRKEKLNTGQWKKTITLPMEMFDK